MLETTKSAKPRTRVFTLMQVFVLVLGVSSCSKSPPEQAILNNIKSMQAGVESKNAGDAVEFISDRFIGNRQADKKMIRRILMAQFLRHNEIGVTITRLDIKVSGADAVRANMEAVLVLTGVEHILPTDGRLLKVTGEWELVDDDWLLVGAKWQ